MTGKAQLPEIGLATPDNHHRIGIFIPCFLQCLLQAANCPAGKPSGTPTEGVWAAGFEGSVSVPTGDYVLMAATNDPAADLFAPGTNQGYLQVSVAGTDDNFTVELSRTLGEECTREGGP